MKDSKTIRNEHQTFVDAWKKIQEDNSNTPVKEGYKDVKKMLKTNKKGYKTEKVLVRKSDAFTALAEKYDMAPKQFARYVEANQHLFDIPTRKKAVLANKFQGFKENKEWDEFFGDLELVESKAPYVVHTADMKGNTPAWQGYVEGKLNEVTGEPLYVAGEDIQEMDNMGGPAAIAGVVGAGLVGAKKIIQGVGNLRKGIKNTTDKKNKIINQVNDYEPEGEELQEITTKDTKSGTKFKVRVKDKKSNSSYIRFATRDKIAQLRSDPKIASVEMTDEGQTPEERGEKKAQAAGGGSMKKAKKDYDGDGKVESGTAEYMGSKDKAIKKAMKKRSVTTEAQSNWRDDLKEIMGEVEKTEGKKSKSKKVKNGVCINPDTDDEKNKYEEVKPMTSVTGDGSPLSPRHSAGGDLSQYDKDGKPKRKSLNKVRGTAFKGVREANEVAENLGGQLKALEIEDADGKVAYEVIDLVKPDPMKENVMLTYKSGKGVDASIGGRSVRNTISNVKKAGETIKNIKSDGLVAGVKKTFNKNDTNKTSVNDKVSSAINTYKSSLKSSHELDGDVISEVESTNMFPPGTQEKVKKVLDKGSSIIKKIPVLNTIFKSKNKGSDYTPSGKVAR